MRARKERRPAGADRTGARGTTCVRNEIRRLRFEHGEMTQQELADSIGVTRQTVVAIERAKYSPTLELAFKIAAAFGRPLDEVFLYEARGSDGPDGSQPSPAGAG